MLACLGDVSRVLQENLTQSVNHISIYRKIILKGTTIINLSSVSKNLSVP